MNKSRSAVEGCEGQNGNTCNWLWKPLTPGHSNILLIGILEAVSWYMVCAYIICELRLRDVEKKSPLLSTDKIILSNDYPRLVFQPLVQFATWEKVTGGSNVIKWYLCSWPLCWKTDRYILPNGPRRKNFSLMQRPVNFILTLIQKWENEIKCGKIPRC